MSTIPALIATRAREFPDHPFLVSWQAPQRATTVSFLEFAVRVELATAALADLGIAEAVGLLSHNSAEFWVFACAVVCRGAPCVLLNHRLPAPTLAAMAASAAVRRLIFSPAPRMLAVRTDALAPCGAGAAGGWSAYGLLLDLGGCALSAVGTIGLCALVPRRPTLWADAGRRSLKNS